MREKPSYLPFNEYLNLFEELTGCQLKVNQNVIKKRLERFLNNLKIKPENSFKVEKLIKEREELRESFFEVFIPTESFFFREEEYLNLTITIANKNNLRKILVIPCANGETVYSLKIIAKEKNGENITITGKDILAKAIKKAKEGIYGLHAVKNISPATLKKYFTHKNGKFIVNNDIKKGITFKTENLATSKGIEKYDIILCRNFLIYLKEKSVKLILKNLCNMLKPKGILILGKSELSFIKHNPHFTKEKYGNLLYFRKTTWQNC